MTRQELAHALTMFAVLIGAWSAIYALAYWFALLVDLTFGGF